MATREVLQSIPGTEQEKTKKTKPDMEPGEPLVKLLEALRNNVLISFFPDKVDAASPLGDTFVRAWAIRTILLHVSQLHGIHVVSPQISFYDTKNSTIPTFNFYQYFPQTYKSYQLDEIYTKQEKNNRFTQRHLHEFADLLGITLPNEVLNAVPTPFDFQHPKFRPRPETQGNETPTPTVNQEAIDKEVQRIKEKARGRKIIVVNWAGSRIEKRLSFHQVRFLVRKIKALYPHLYVVVLSDSKTPSKMISQSFSFSESDEEYAQLLETYDPVSYSRTPSTNQFENGTIKLSQRDAKQGAVKEKSYSLPADEFVSIENLNQLAAYGQAADVVIGTDTFWSWWHANAKKLIILYTIADDYYEVPNCIPIYSKALADKTIQHSLRMIGTGDYNEFFSGKNKTRNKLGPSDSDFRKLVKTVEATLRQVF